MHQTLIVEEFEPDVFRQLIEYIHTGCVTLQPRTLLGECGTAGGVKLCIMWYYVAIAALLDVVKLYGWS